MADFLSRLVERAAGVATVSRPRVAPLFAQGPTLPEEALEAVDELPADPDPALPYPITPPRKFLARDPTAAERPPAPGAPPAPATVERRVIDALVTAPRARGPDAVRDDPAPSSEVSPSRATRSAPEVDARAATAPRRRARADARSPAPEVDRLVTVRPRPREDGVPLRPRAAAPHRAEEPPPAPIIRVSIGRIEVRAVSAAPPVAARAAAPRKAPSLSLEEYLKPRSAGR